MERPRHSIREYEPGDEVEILATFNRVFSQIDPGFEPRDLRSWRWQYLENPSGSRIMLAVSDSGRVVSQYAGVGQRVRLDGRSARFSQSVDSMTDLEWRRGLGNPGIFVLTGVPFAEHFGGPPPDGDVVMWGNPVPAAWRIGSRHLGYEFVRTQLKLVREVGGGSAKSSLEVREVDRFPAAVDGLFDRVAEGRGAIAVRDAAQMNWRFVERPGHDYRCAVAARGGELAGLAVYRASTFDDRPAGVLCDWLVPAEDIEARRALLGWLAGLSEQDARPLVAVFPDTAPEWLAFQDEGFRAQPTRHIVAARSFDSRWSVEWLREHWYYTLGDTDLC